MKKLTKRERMDAQEPLVQSIAEDFGKNLRVARERRGVTQDTLAGMVGTKHPRISDMERGLVDVRMSDLVGLAHALEAQLHELVDTHVYFIEVEEPPAEEEGEHVPL